MNNMKLTVYAISQLLKKTDKYLLYGQFLDDFKNANEDERYYLIYEEPEFIEEESEFMCLLAGVVEMIAKNNNITVPKWTLKDKYFMRDSCYAFNTENIEFQKYLKYSTPYELSKRNLFMGNNVLERI